MKTISVSISLILVFMLLNFIGFDNCVNSQTNSNGKQSDSLLDIFYLKNIPETLDLEDSLVVKKLRFLDLNQTKKWLYPVTKNYNYQIPLNRKIFKAVSFQYCESKYCAVILMITNYENNALISCEQFLVTLDKNGNYIDGVLVQLNEDNSGSWDSIQNAIQGQILTGSVFNKDTITTIEKSYYQDIDNELISWDICRYKKYVINNIGIINQIKDSVSTSKKE